jgi:hypothetical protein
MRATALLATALAACSQDVLLVAPASDASPPAARAAIAPRVAGPEEPRGWLCRPNGLDLGQGVDDGILLIGAQALSNGGRRSILIERRKDHVTIVACWHALLASDAFRLTKELPSSELEEIWRLQPKDREFLKDDWRYTIRTRRAPAAQVEPSKKKPAPSKKKPKLPQKPEVQATGSEIVSALMDLLRRHSGDVRLVPLKGEAIDESGAILPRVLLASLASYEIAQLWGGGRPRDDDWERVIELARFRNAAIVEKLVALLTDDRPWISASAASALAQVRGVPLSTPSNDHAAWWDQTRKSYDPVAPPRLTSPQLRLLGKGVSGFSAVEIDTKGELWAQSKIIDRTFKYDSAGDRFLESVEPPLPPTLWVRPPAIAVLRHRVALTPLAREEPPWISRDERWALIWPRGPADAEDRLVFASLGVPGAAISSAQRFPLPSRSRSAYAMASIEGRYVAMARASEGRTWSEPHSIVVLDTEAKKERVAPIPIASRLRPIAVLSAREGGFLVLRDERRPLDPRPAPVELWWLSEDGAKADRRFAGTTGGDEIFRAWPHSTPDGSTLLVTLETREKTGARFEELGWLALRSGEFSSILRTPKPLGLSPTLAPDQEREVTATIDGSRVVLLHDGQAFEWKR